MANPLVVLPKTLRKTDVRKIGTRSTCVSPPSMPNRMPVNRQQCAVVCRTLFRKRVDRTYWNGAVARSTDSVMCWGDCSGHHPFESAPHDDASGPHQRALLNALIRTRWIPLHHFNGHFRPVELSGSLLTRFSVSESIATSPILAQGLARNPCCCLTQGEFCVTFPFVPY